MDLWKTRNETEEWLKGCYKRQSECLDEGFMILDECINSFDRKSHTSNGLIGPFSKICGLTAAKARNLVLGCYSLSIDALSQEAGALLRPCIETYELLVYFRHDPSRISQVENRKLPQPGKIAKKIDGDFHKLRSYLNNNASHFRFSSDSTQHLYDYKTDSINTIATHGHKMFLYNLSWVFVFIYFVLVECVNCLDYTLTNTDEIASSIQRWKHKGMILFGLIECPGGQSN